ncbi:MAG: type III-B CRISPR module RAMP protein Cmr6 [Thermoprotei archaeon]|nr:MAG: type III-B CRISPR module RAMP protein Cmr6 [Thermoprotei archaeon]
MALAGDRMGVGRGRRACHGGSAMKLDLSVKVNVYSAIVREFLEEVLRDVERRAHTSFTLFSSSITKRLSKIFKGQEVWNLLEFTKRWTDEVYDAASRLFGVAFRFSMRTMTRLTINTRDAYMPLEIGVAWHPYFNVPYIPATALKGALRAYFRSCSVEVCGLGEEELFGTWKRRGEEGGEREGVLRFFDALPVSCEKGLVEPDIVNPHYPEVEGVIDEASVRPRPLVYPAVPRGVTFSAIIAADLSEVKCDQGRFVARLLKEVQEALAGGLGARTSLGYGILEVKLDNFRWVGV